MDPERTTTMGDSDPVQRINPFQIIKAVQTIKTNAKTRVVARLESLNAVRKGERRYCSRKPPSSTTAGLGIVVVVNYDVVCCWLVAIASVVDMLLLLDWWVGGGW